MSDLRLHALSQVGSAAAQVALLIFKLLGGNLAGGQPGDLANIYTYNGPKAIKVCEAFQVGSSGCMQTSVSV